MNEKRPDWLVAIALEVPAAVYTDVAKRAEEEFKARTELGFSHGVESSAKKLDELYDTYVEKSQTEYERRGRSPTALELGSMAKALEEGAKAVRAIAPKVGGEERVTELERLLKVAEAALDEAEQFDPVCADDFPRLAKIREAKAALAAHLRKLHAFI